MNQQRQKLHDLQTLIDNLGSTSETVSDKAFEDRLKEAEKSIMDLLDEAQTSKGASLDPFRDFMIFTCNVSLA